jgi:hypothetical protein
MPTLEQAIKKHRTILAGYDLPEVEDEMEAQFYWDDFLYEVETMMKKMLLKY